MKKHKAGAYIDTYIHVCVCAPSPPKEKRRVRVSWTHKDLKFFFFFDAAASPPSCTPIVVPLFLRKLEHNSYFRSQTILILIYIYIVVCLFCLCDSNTHTHTHQSKCPLKTEKKGKRGVMTVLPSHTDGRHTQK